jgi:hypothetical protein
VKGLNVVDTYTVAGPMGEISWLVRHENASSIEAAIGAPMGSEQYLAEVEGGGEFFMPGATQIYAQRFALDRLFRAPPVSIRPKSSTR